MLLLSLALGVHVCISACVVYMHMWSIVVLTLSLYPMFLMLQIALFMNLKMIPGLDKPVCQFHVPYIVVLLFFFGTHFNCIYHRCYCCPILTHVLYDSMLKIVSLFLQWSLEYLYYHGTLLWVYLVFWHCWLPYCSLWLGWRLFVDVSYIIMAVFL